MSSFNLYIDITTGALVQGIQNSQSASLPPFVQGDTLNLNVYLLQPTGAGPSGAAPYTNVGTAGLTLEVVIGDKIGNANNWYAQQLACPPDATNSFFQVSLNLNTVAVTTLLGTNPSAPTWLEVKFLSGGIPTTVLEQAIQIQAAVNKLGNSIPVVVTGQTFMSAETANALFLKRTVVGQIILQSANTGKQVALYVDDDGTVKMDPIN